MLSPFGLGSLLLSVAILLSEATAHYRFTTLYTVNTGWSTAFQYVRPTSNNPVTDITSTDLRCGVGSPAGTSTGTATVSANTIVGMRLDTGQVINHPGVLNVYLGQVPTPPTLASQWDGSGAHWFKIYQINDGGRTWPTTGQSEFLFPIPANTLSGQYLLRIEHIALHGGAQFYIGCAQINIVGAGTGNPNKVSIPGVYTATDPGLLFDMYSGTAAYIQPGPAVWTG